MKLYNTLTKKKRRICTVRREESSHVCLRTDGIQFYPYWKCKTDDRI